MNQRDHLSRRTVINTHSIVADLHHTQLKKSCQFKIYFESDWLARDGYVEYAFRILLEAILYIITYNSANSWNSLSALYSSLKNRNSNENHRIFEVQISQCTLDVTLEAAYFFRSNIESSRGHVCNLQTTKIVVVSKRPCRCCPFISAVTAVVHWERLWAVRSTR